MDTVTVTPRSASRPLSHRSALLGVAALTVLALSACGSSDPLGGGAGTPADATDGASGGTGGTAEGQTLVVGSQQYYSNEIIAELYAQALEDEGYTVDRQYQIGQREVYLPEVESGAIDVFPEYTGNLLQYYEKDTEATSPEEVEAALAEALPEGLSALEAAEATDQDSYNVTQEFADEHGLSSLADLSKVGSPLSVAANSEFESRPYGPQGLSETYGVDVTVVPVEDSGGPLTVKALQDGDVQLADIYSADPSIETNGFVTLEDPENLILPQNIVPIVSSKVDPGAAAAIEEVNALLTTEELISLNRTSVEDQAASREVAQTWLEEQGLLQD